MLAVDERPEMDRRKSKDGDLDYYAKPENYQGTKDSMLRFLTTHCAGRDGIPAINEPTGSSPDRLTGLPREADTSQKAHPVTGVWTYNRGTYVRRITVNPVSEGGQQTEGEFAGEEKRDGRYSKSATGRRDDGPCDTSDGSRSSATGGGRTAQSKEIARETARNRIRRAIRIVLISLRWMTLIEKQESRAAADQDDPTVIQRTFTDIGSEVTNTDDAFTFDLSQYKLKREVVITRDVRQILTTPLAQRTPEHIQTAVYGLKHLESFAEYPQHMREKLCQVGWFQQVSPKRVIIRQGQPPENFYFILSGQAVVRFHEQNPTTGENQIRTAAMLRKGSSFGELALLHHTRRTATVVSQDVVQLLAIGKEDFFSIIMGLSPDGSVPDHIRFLSTLKFMHGWPIDVLANNRDKCMVLYFKRGTVMVRDSTKSDWIYVVKSGSCQVIKKLNAVAPRTLRQRRLQDDLRRFPPELNASIAFSNIVKSSRRKSSQVEVEITDSESNQSYSSDSNPQSPGSAVESGGGRWSYAGAVVPSKAVPASDKGESIFVEVETLLPKDTFGLRNINFEMEFEPPTGPEASVILVSKGAECIMLSKKCFTENASASVRHWVRSELRPYPTDAVIEGSLQTHVDWMAYKKHLVHAFANARSERRRQNRAGHWH